jgi:hypothetical protein
MSAINPVPGNPLPNRINDQLFQARLKANEFVQEHLKTLVTIASGTLRQDPRTPAPPPPKA